MFLIPLLEKFETGKAIFTEILSDEAISGLGEKIRENAEKTAPKTPEERRKDAIKEAIEEATGVEQSDGMLSEIMDELENMEETMEQAEESTEELQESMDTVEELQKMEESSGNMISPDGRTTVTDLEEVPGIYKSIDYRV